ncbi:MAG: hypothetical protein ACHQHN_03900 [Sphingobacteriales bacterium]
MLKNTSIIKWALCLVTILITCLSFKQENAIKSKFLFGKWHPYQEYGSDGVHPGRWGKSPDSGKYVKFQKNGRISGTYFTNALSYELKDSVTIAIVYKERVQEYRFKMDKRTLTISPSKPNYCDEGCATKLIKD